MQYILSTDWKEGANQLAKRINQHLADDKKVLWLLSGGSNIAASVGIMSNISDNLSQKLTISLVDERYGEVGHDDSNWKQLIDAGFPAKQATLLPILQQGLSFEDTTASFKEKITAALNSNNLVVAQIGIGDDGHIAGILPNSPAVNEAGLVCGYQSQPFTRITLTFPALKSANTVFAFAFGDSKKPALLKLQQQKLPLSEQPAQILKDLPEVFLYNDQVGENHD